MDNQNKLRNFNVHYKFTSINRLRKDFNGYRTPYELIVCFKLKNFENIVELKSEIQSLIHLKVVQVLKNQDLHHFCKNTNTASILDWIINRLKKIFPYKNTVIFNVRLNEKKLTPISKYFSDSQTVDQIKISNGKILINGKGPYINQLTYQKRLDYLRRCVEILSLRGKISQINKFTNKNDWRSVKDLLHLNDYNRYQLCTFICPPYINNPQSGYSGFFQSVFEEPIKYNFDYNYINVFDNLKKICRLGNFLNIPFTGLIIFCDWGLINIDNILKHTRSEDIIKHNLNNFYQSLKILSHNKYQNISITRLSDLGVQSYLPFGLPYTAQERKVYIKKLINDSSSPIFKVIELKFLYRLVKWATTKNLNEALNWKNFIFLNNWGEQKSELVSILKTYNNICWIKINSLKKQPQFSDLITTANQQLRVESFYDALLRYIEYKIYGYLLSQAFCKSICIYQDPGFPMAGHHFRNSNLPVLFIDPQLIQENLYIQHE